MTKEAAKKELEKLINDYVIHRDEYSQKSYDEIQFCTRVLNKFFKILGWDVDNDANNSEYYCDVSLQYKLKKDGTAKRPDYAFGFPARTNTKFFVEAKTPATQIKTDKDAAHQVRRYGNTARLAISVLSNFEELAIYDCSRKVRTSDSANSDRRRYFTYTQYLDNFDFIWDTFSLEGIKKGNFDKFIQTDTSKKGTIPLDMDFVATLDDWRIKLAKNIAENNQWFTNEEINYAVQQTIDRIVFLRFCEDRGTGRFGALKEAIEKGDHYRNLFAHFKKADEKYNSGIFDFDRDSISHKLKIDNKVVKSIIEVLYRPNNDYEFGVMPVEVLGNAYEEFLGKVIHVTPGHHAKINVDKKPEVQKAGGVFYTPQYIVNYIVENTVGKLIKGKTPEQISKIRILDPACGSGSFLLGAYMYLLRYHSDYYWKKDYHKKKIANNPLTPAGQLTVAEKKRILLNNLYGVDIDANAVEVTKLSLLLKAMEGETEASIGHQLHLYKKGILPDLDKNIQCGNSLIELDIYEGRLPFEKIDEKIKPFSWKSAFPKVFKDGGFDVIIGNPPYVQLAMFDWFDENQNAYLLNKFSSSMGRMNTFGFFIEKGIALLSVKGVMGYIIPNTILTQEYYQGLRKLILSKTQIENIVSYEKLVFANAIVETTTLILSKKRPSSKTIVTFCDKNLLYTNRKIDQKIFNHSYQNQFSVTFSEGDNLVRTKIDKNSRLTFNDIGEINQAIALKENRRAYLFEKKKGENYKPVVDGREINRYQMNWSGKYLKYDINAIHSCKREDIFLSSEKIFFRRVSSRLIGTIDTNKVYALNTIVVINKRKNIEFDLRFILGLFNSRLLNYYYIKFLKSTKKVFSEIQARQIGQLPFPDISLKNKVDKSRHDNVVRYVRELQKYYASLVKVKNETQIKSIQHKIDYFEEQVNQIIYELYGLNKKEIEIIEKSFE